MTKTRKDVAQNPEQIEVVYSAAVSLDGFIADENGGVDWLHAAMVPDEGCGCASSWRRSTSVLMGSLTYEKSLELGIPVPARKPRAGRRQP